MLAPTVEKGDLNVYLRYRCSPHPPFRSPFSKRRRHFVGVGALDDP